MGVDNRTRRYLADSLLAWTPSIIPYIKPIKPAITGFYIGHNNTTREDILFVIIDQKKLPILGEHIAKIKEHPAYIKDYPIGDLLASSLHCLILKLPINNIVNLFLLGKYSKMYTVNQIKLFFHGSPRIQEVLSKSKDLRRELEKELGVALDEDAELDSIPNIQDEVFQTTLDSQVVRP